MSQADRDLVAAIRAELAAIDPARPCDRLAESAGLGADLVTREAAVARLAVRLGRATDVGVVLATRHRPKHLHTREAAPVAAVTAGAPGSFGGAAASVDAAAQGVGGAIPSAGGASPLEARRSQPSFDWARSAEHCRLAWLRGRFLARGSLSIGNGRTHLEFVLGPDEAPLLAARLDELGMPATWRVRRGRGVVTWKSTETVQHFLRRVGAGTSLLELEARQVSRALRGDLNRVINAESANLQRSVGAASRQLQAIAALEASGRLGEQSYHVRLVAEARRETPEATLGELAERLELHRSAVQRALDRLERLAREEPRPRRASLRSTHADRPAGPARTPAPLA